MDGEEAALCALILLKKKEVWPQTTLSAPQVTMAL